MVAVRKAVRAKLLTFALNCCHLHLKVFCCPGVTGFCAVSLNATFLNVMMCTQDMSITFGRCHGMHPKIVSTSRIAHSS